MSITSLRRRDQYFPKWVLETAELPIAFCQVREDATQDQWVIQQRKKENHILMVASGGCTAATLAALPQVKSIHIVDPNPAQIALTRLKLHMLQKEIPTPERLGILGHELMPTEERHQKVVGMLEELEIPLDTFGAIEPAIEFGLDHYGRYEQVFAQLRYTLRDVQKELHELLQLNSPAEQAPRVAPQTALRNALESAFQEVMALPNLVRIFGEEATRNSVMPFAKHFFHRTCHVLMTLPAQNNPYLHQIFRGKYPHTLAPWFTKTPKHLPQVTWEVADMAQSLKNALERDRKYHFIHLSNILDWLSPEVVQSVLELTAKLLKPGGTVIIRQLNSNLDIPSLGTELHWRIGEAESLHVKDRSYFYRALYLGSPK